MVISVLGRQLTSALISEPNAMQESGQMCVVEMKSSSARRTKFWVTNHKKWADARSGNLPFFSKSPSLWSISLSATYSDTERRYIKESST